MSASGVDSSIKAGLIAGFIDVILTLTALLLSNSGVLLADTLKTTLEFIAVLIAWETMRQISKNSGHKFQYGLGKLENMSSLIVAFLMTVCIILIVVNAIKSMLHPDHIKGVGIWICLVSQLVYGVVNGYLWKKNRKIAVAESSPMMESQAKLFLTKTLGNVFIFSSVGLSCVLTSYGWSVYIDPCASLLIAISIFLSALGILSNSLFDLMDRTLEESHQIVILRALAKHFHEYESMHGIRSRRSGSEVFVDIFLEFQKNKTVAEVQSIIDSICRHIEDEIKGSHVAVCLATHNKC